MLVLNKHSSYEDSLLLTTNIFNDKKKILGVTVLKRNTYTDLRIQINIDCGTILTFFIILNQVSSKRAL